MQEQNEPKEQESGAKVDWKSWVSKKYLVPAGVFCALLLAGMVTGLVLYRGLPTCHWREIQTEFPWEGKGVTVSKLKCHWQDSTGDERMELRAAFYPTAVITLREKCTGKGHLIVRFLDDKGVPNGQTIYLPYNEGGFVFREEPNVLAMGKEATVHSEVGFRTRNDFYNHALAEERPLWRVSVHNHPEGAGADEPLGFVTIPATDKAK